MTFIGLHLPYLTFPEVEPVELFPRILQIAAGRAGGSGGAGGVRMTADRARHLGEASLAPTIPR